jgi:hypothetical protein
MRTATLTSTEQQILDWLTEDFARRHGRPPAPGDVLLVDEETGDEFALAEVIEVS